MSQNKTFNTPFLLTTTCTYPGYFLHGISVITLAQNMTSLVGKFSTGNAGIAHLVSGIGLGRLVSILFFGVLSDKFGRRAIILLGAIPYILFSSGIPASLNLMAAFIPIVCAGVANSALGTGGYSVLMECFPKASGSAAILVEAMVSSGQMVYPIVVSAMLLNHIWYGYVVIIPGTSFVVITLMLLKSRFSSQVTNTGIVKNLPQMNSKPLVWLGGVTSVMLGIATFSTLYVTVVWAPKYVMVSVSTAESDALKTISHYSMGSLVCVFTSAALSRE